MRFVFCDLRACADRSPRKTVSDLLMWCDHLRRFPETSHLRSRPSVTPHIVAPRRTRGTALCLHHASASPPWLMLRSYLRELTTAFQSVKTLFLNTSYYEDMVELQHNAIAAARAAGVTDGLRSADGTIKWRKNCRNLGRVGPSCGGSTSCRIFWARASTSSRTVPSTRLPARQDSVHRLSGYGRGRLRHAYATGTPRQEICPDRKRSDVLPAGCGDHRRGDRQASALRR